VESEEANVQVMMNNLMISVGHQSKPENLNNDNFKNSQQHLFE
jgi:hypothetical protein